MTAPRPMELMSDRELADAQSIDVSDSRLTAAISRERARRRRVALADRRRIVLSGECPHCGKRFEE